MRRCASFLWNRDRRPDGITRSLHQKHAGAMICQQHSLTRRAWELFCVWCCVDAAFLSRISTQFSPRYHTTICAREGCATNTYIANTLDLSARRRTRYWYWILWYSQQLSHVPRIYFPMHIICKSLWLKAQKILILVEYGHLKHSFGMTRFGSFSFHAAQTSLQITSLLIMSFKSVTQSVLMRREPRLFS
jgi:hypothetical protein